jgi:hypothetical protein
MCAVEIKVTPVITGTTGTIRISFRKYLSNKLVKHDIKQLQYTVVLGTELITGKVLL